MREIKIKGDSATINVTSVFGGSSLKLPDGYNIIVHSTAILGGNENKNKNQHKKGNKTIYINYFSVFGGTEIE